MAISQLHDYIIKQSCSVNFVISWFLNLYLLNSKQSICHIYSVKAHFEEKKVYWHHEEVQINDSANYT